MNKRDEKNRETIQSKGNGEEGRNNRLESSNMKETGNRKDR